MDNLRPLRWKEGMFLRPHHMQQHELNLEAREAARLEALESHGWGLLRVDIQEEALKNFSFVVRSLRAMMPDGTFLDVPGNARLPSRAFDALMKEAGRPLDVFFGVRVRAERSPQVSVDAEGRTRYAVRESEVHDIDVGRDPATVEFLEYDLRLFFGDEPSQGYDLLPLARLVRTGDAARPVGFSHDFASPCAWLGASPVLQETTRAVVERLANARRKQADVKGSGDAKGLLLYQVLSSSLPVLRHLMQDGRVHPHVVYVELARLAGALSFHPPDASVDDIPVYDHRDPAPVFLKLNELIRIWGEYVHRRLYEKVPMVRSGDFFQCTLPADFKLPGTRFFIQAQAEQSTSRLRVLMTGAKISTPGRITETLRPGALPGVPNAAIEGFPSELGSSQTGSFFELKTEHDEWGNQVVPSGELTVFILNAPADVKLYTVVVFSKT